MGPSKAERFIETYCSFTKGDKAGQPFTLEDDQRQILTDIFSDVDARGKRRKRTYYLCVPRKWGKTELAAAIALYMPRWTPQKRPYVDVSKPAKRGAA